MNKKEWYIEIFNKLEIAKEQVEPGDFHFYNLSHLPLVAKYTELNSSECKTCLENKNIITSIVDNLPDLLNSNLKTRKEFEMAKNKVEQHLKRKHHMRFPGYYKSLCAFWGVIVAFIVSSCINYLYHKELLNSISLIFIAGGLLIGMLIGKVLDKKLFLKNLQL